MEGESPTLNFQSHTKTIIKTANEKLSAYQSCTVYDWFHEKGLRALLNNENLTLDDMLSKNNDITIHVKYIQKLKIEFYQ